MRVVVFSLLVAATIAGGEVIFKSGEYKALAVLNGKNLELSGPSDGCVTIDGRCVKDVLTSHTLRVDENANAVAQLNKQLTAAQAEIAVLSELTKKHDEEVAELKALVAQLTNAQIVYKNATATQFQHIEDVQEDLKDDISHAAKASHPCRDGSHGCDKTIYGNCYETTDATGYRCGCVEGYHTLTQHDPPHTAHRCAKITPAPTPFPTPSPTPSPTPAPTPAWSAWSSWSGCDQKCDQGSQYRTRTCGNTAGSYCEGDNRETQSCQIRSCPSCGMSFHQHQHYGGWAVHWNGKGDVGRWHHNFRSNDMTALRVWGECHATTADGHNGGGARHTFYPGNYDHPIKAGNDRVSSVRLDWNF